MKQEFDLRRAVNDVLDDVVWLDQSGFELLDLTRRIFPDLMTEAILLADESAKAKLAQLKSLVDSHQITIATNESPKPKRGLGEDIRAVKYRAGNGRGYSLSILINPTITYALSADDDKKEVLSRVQQVMLETHSLYQGLLRSRQFVPRTEI